MTKTLEEVREEYGGIDQKENVAGVTVAVDGEGDVWIGSDELAYVPDTGWGGLQDALESAGVLEASERRESGAEELPDEWTKVTEEGQFAVYEDRDGDYRLTDQAPENVMVCDRGSEPGDFREALRETGLLEDAEPAEPERIDREPDHKVGPFEVYENDDAGGWDLSNDGGEETMLVLDDDAYGGKTDLRDVLLDAGILPDAEPSEEAESRHADASEWFEDLRAAADDTFYECSVYATDAYTKHYGPDWDAVVYAPTSANVSEGELFDRFNESLRYVKGDPSGDVEQYHVDPPEADMDQTLVGFYFGAPDHVDVSTLETAESDDESRSPEDVAEGWYRMEDAGGGVMHFPVTETVIEDRTAFSDYWAAEEEPWMANASDGGAGERKAYGWHFEDIETVEAAAVPHEVVSDE